MKHEQYTVFARGQWEKTMRESEHFSLEKCTAKEKIGVWDKMAPTYDLGLGTDPRRVDMALKRLEVLGAFPEGAIALDIGSGTGAYTLALAEKCGEVYALDNSAGMQKVLVEKARERGLDNITSVYEDWKTLDVNSLPCKFDVVLSSLNTGINNYDSLVKMNEASRGFCCYCTPHGTAKHSARSELQKIVFGRELHAAGGNDIIHAFNIIYGLGYRPELTYAPSVYTRIQSPQEALETVCRDFGRYMELDDCRKTGLRAYINEHLDADGMFTQTQESTIGIMIWRV